MKYIPPCRRAGAVPTPVLKTETTRPQTTAVPPITCFPSFQAPIQAQNPKPHLFDNKKIIQQFLGKETGVNLDSVIRYTMICLSKCEDNYLNALSLFENIKELEITGNPDARMYGSVILACEKAGKWEECLKLLAETKANGFHTNAFSYGVTISACKKAKKWDECLKLFRELKEMKIQPEIRNCNAVLSACADAGKWEEAISVFSDMNELNVPKDLATYMTMFSIYEQTKEWCSAFKLVRDAVDRGLYCANLGLALNRHTIDFHMPAVYLVGNLEDKGHSFGVPLPVAKVILKYHLEHDLKNFGTITLIVGQHGNGILKNGIELFIQENYNEIITIAYDQFNPGILILKQVNTMKGTP